MPARRFSFVVAVALTLAFVTTAGTATAAPQNAEEAAASQFVEYAIQKLGKLRKLDTYTS